MNIKEKEQLIKVLADFRKQVEGIMTSEHEKLEHLVKNMRSVENHLQEEVENGR